MHTVGHLENLTKKKKEEDFFKNVFILAGSKDKALALPLKSNIKNILALNVQCALWAWSLLYYKQVHCKIIFNIINWNASHFFP